MLNRVKNSLENDALSLEYKLYERSTIRYLDLADTVNNPAILGVLRPDERSLEKESFSFLGVNFCPFSNNISD